MRGDEVILSHHLGDLKHALGYEYFRKAIEDLCRLFEVKPEWIAHDLHPAYLSTQWAKELAKKWGVPLIRRAAPSRPRGRGAGGTRGYRAGPGHRLRWRGLWRPTARSGAANCCWSSGGEIERLAHLRPIPLAGGDAAARDTRRCAAGVMWEMGQERSMGCSEDGMERPIVAGDAQERHERGEELGGGAALRRGGGPAGRLQREHHEAQAAMALESAGELGVATMQDGDGHDVRKDEGEIVAGSAAVRRWS